MDRHGEVDGYTVNIVEFRQDMDQTPMLKGLPDDRCQCRRCKAADSAAGKFA